LPPNSHKYVSKSGYVGDYGNEYVLQNDAIHFTGHAVLPDPMHFITHNFMNRGNKPLT
jgi:hypothetical protein